MRLNNFRKHNVFLSNFQKIEERKIELSLEGRSTHIPNIVWRMGGVGVDVGFPIRSKIDLGGL